MALTITDEQQQELDRRASSRTIRAQDGKRAKVILMPADGVPYWTVEATLWCYARLPTFSESSWSEWISASKWRSVHGYRPRDQ
jgi:hypothetical protein